MKAKARDIDPRKLDVAALAKTGATLEGAWPVAGFGRLTDLLSGPPAGDVRWQVQVTERPQRSGAPRIQLSLRASGRLDLTCQRCLQACAHEVGLERLIHFARDEAEAERLDAESEDDVLALTRSLDLHDLLEDEMLLDLPLVPRHDQCPVPVNLATADVQPAAEPAPNPFAALASLKRGGDGG